VSAPLLTLVRLQIPEDLVQATTPLHRNILGRRGP
jgi:hypothetical protein